MAQVLFDTLAYTETLKRGGISDDQAKLHAQALDSALHEAVATKGDIKDLKNEIALVRKDMEALQRIVLGIGVSLGVGIALLVIKAFL